VHFNKKTQEEVDDDHNVRTEAEEDIYLCKGM
jgi:hypothetical protein